MTIPSIHNFKPHFKPVTFIRPKWQMIHNTLFRPGRFSSFSMNYFRNLLQKNRQTPLPNPPEAK